MAFAEDLTPYFADFGDDATLDGVAVRGIFDEPAITPGLAGIAVGATEPQFQLPTASVPDAIYDLALVVPGQGSFTVREHLPDGTGMSLLLLQRTA